MLRRIALLTSAATLSACAAVGPDFKGAPAPAAGAGYVAASEHQPSNLQITADGPQARWWTLFGSPGLSQTVEAAIAGSPTLDAAQARLVAARERITVANAALYPQVSLNAGAAREKESTASFGLPDKDVRLPPNFNLYQIGLNVSYSPDIFGGTRRSVEARRAYAEVRRYELDAAAASLAGNAAMRVVEIAALRAQLSALDEILDGDRQTLSLVRRQRDVGTVSDRDVVAAEAQLTADEALRPPLEKGLSATRHSLAALVGTTPAQWSPPDIDLGDLRLPAALPATLPSDLVRRRPDIEAAEAQLHSASAEIGVATARLYPQITLSAGYTASSLNGLPLFDPASAAWSIAGGLVQPLFDGGARRAENRAVVAEFRASEADYRQTVLQAFSQVGDTLTALDHDNSLLQAQGRAYDVASESLRLERINYAGGEGGILSLLDSQRQLQRAALGRAQVQGQLYLDAIQLIVAAGGSGWPSPSEDRAQITATSFVR
jgi:NodT family efflux transporter outer membrane factor (OMF) lipoprotein